MLRIAVRSLRIVSDNNDNRIVRSLLNNRDIINNGIMRLLPTVKLPN